MCGWVVGWVGCIGVGVWGGEEGGGVRCGGGWGVVGWVWGRES